MMAMYCGRNTYAWASKVSQNLPLSYIFILQQDIKVHTIIIHNSSSSFCKENDRNNIANWFLARIRFYLFTLF